MYHHIAAALVGLLLSQPVWAWDQQANHYKVRIDAKAQKAHIEADVWVAGHTLMFFGVEPLPNLPNGQADLMENLTVVDGAGQPVATKNLGEGEFALQGDRRLRYRYDIRLEHDRYAWPGGVEEVLYRTDEGILASGYALFLAPGEKMLGETRVTFDLPAGWQAHTPWQATASPDVFIAETRKALANNVIFMGTARTETLKSGGMEVQMVLGKPYWPARSLFRELFQKQLDSYLALFGGPPQSKRYLVVVNAGASGDGGAFSGSFSQLINGTAERQTLPIWGRVMAHELLHFWNGLTLVPKDGHEEWFKEGVTDYLTLTSMARNELISRQALMQWFENLSRGQSVARQAQGLTMPISAAAADKHRNWLLVYGGGSIAALALDVELRKATQGKQGLPDVMRAMHAEFGQAGKRYDFADLLRVIRSTTGYDATALLERIINQPAPYDLRPVFADLGLRLEQYMLLEHHLLKDHQADAAARARFTQLTGLPY
ncbi:hypothetical protein [Chitinimonas sp. BJYL2]|uniref:M61 family metallopeptidase n=1 Tax=Chitinimonas sp. BJYL2 TaxID=2976696 RepID=UPI0022B56809|nr:hypothetical protein [Chitinimonas sp. BJYL2]